MSNIKDRIETINFSLSIKEKELESIPVNKFTYNPKIAELMYEIKRLKAEKEELESAMED